MYYFALPLNSFVLDLVNKPESLYEVTFNLKHFLGFSVEEINNMTIRESNSYVQQYKDFKNKEKEAIEKARVNQRNNRGSRKSKKRR